MLHGGYTHLAHERIVLEALDRGGLPAEAHLAAEVSENGLHDLDFGLHDDIDGVGVVDVAEICRRAASGVCGRGLRGGPIADGSRLAGE